MFFFCRNLRTYLIALLFSTFLVPRLVHAIGVEEPSPSEAAQIISKVKNDPKFKKFIEDVRGCIKRDDLKCLEDKLTKPFSPVSLKHFPIFEAFNCNIHDVEPNLEKAGCPRSYRSCSLNVKRIRKPFYYDEIDRMDFLKCIRAVYWKEFSAILGLDLKDAEFSVAIEKYKGIKKDPLNWIGYTVKGYPDEFLGKHEIADFFVVWFVELDGKWKIAALIGKSGTVD